MRKVYIILFVLIFCFFSYSCAASGSSPNGGSSSEDNGSLGNYEISNNLDELTAITIDDNENYNYWSSLINPSMNYKFSYYYNKFPFLTLNRITVEFKKGVYAEVSLIDKEQNALFIATPNADGLCYLFPKYKADQYDIQIKYYNKDYELVTVYDRVSLIGLKDNKYDATYLDAALVNKDTIDLMFVVDTTVSMNNEIEFLQSKIEQIVKRVSSRDSLVRTAILLYKDLDDNYITMYSKFTTNIKDQVNFLSNVFAYGGGDFEEAVDIAMNEAVLQDWGGINSTKIIVHIADAPCHDKDVSSWNDAVLNCSKKGIRLITVASTNINVKTEYLFRSATILTGGTYVYITNEEQMGYSPIVNPNLYPEEEYLEYCLESLILNYHYGK